MTLEKDFFSFDLSADACHSQPHKTKIYDEVHPSAALVTDLPNRVMLSLKQWRKSFVEWLVVLFVYPPKPNNVQQIYVEMMKAAIFSKRLPLRSQHAVFLLYVGIKKEEFIIQAYLYLPPEWLDQWQFDFVVSENILSYIPLTAQNPATF